MLLRQTNIQDVPTGRRVISNIETRVASPRIISLCPLKWLATYNKLYTNNTHNLVQRSSLFKLSFLNFFFLLII